MTLMDAENRAGPPPFAKGDRIRLDQMGSDDPCPIPPGATGTVLYASWFAGRWQVCVKWDIPRSLNLVVPPDLATVIGVAS